MPIEVVCVCGRRSNVPDQHAGKRGKCPACGAVVSVPVPVPVAAGPDELVIDEPPPGVDPYEPDLPPAPAPVPVPAAQVAAPEPPASKPAEPIEVKFPAVIDVRLVDVTIPFDQLVVICFKVMAAWFLASLIPGFIGFVLYLVIAAQNEPVRH